MSISLGAWAYHIQLGDFVYEEYEVVPDTTNNIQELTAVIKALESLATTDVPVTVYSDSKYVIDGISSWRYNWVKNNWQTANKKPVANKEYWQKLIELSDRQKFIRYEWIKGHQNEDNLNDRADFLVNKAFDEYITDSNK